MLVELLSEEEQWERLKHWLKTSGPQVLALAAVLLLGWYGWKWWLERGDAKAVAARTAYQSILAALDEDSVSDALSKIETLRREQPDSPYVVAADLVAARLHVEANELDRAAERLQRVATTTKDDKLRPVVRIRLARVQSAQGQYDAALATLGTANLGAHEPARLEARGDVLYAKGEMAAALAEYQAARKLLPEEPDPGGVAELLDLKIADLAASMPAPANEAAQQPAQAQAP